MLNNDLQPEVLRADRWIGHTTVASDASLSPSQQTVLTGYAGL